MTATSKPSPAAPKVGTSKVPPHTNPEDPMHDEWVIDQGIDSSFPASDPPSHTPAPPPKGKKFRD